MLNFSAYVNLHVTAHQIHSSKECKMCVEERRDQEHALLLNNP